MAVTPGRPSNVQFGPAMAVADSVLYEGYLLYPYRSSSQKNQIRWQFGVLAPPAWIGSRDPDPDDDGVAGSAESWWNRTECLLEASPQAVVELRLRFLHVALPTEDGCGSVARSQRVDEAVLREVPAMFRVGDAAEHDLVVRFDIAAAALGGATTAIAIDAGDFHDVGDPGAGRSCAALSGRLLIGVDRIPARFPLYKLSIRVENTVEGLGDVDRPRALRHSMLSTHLLVGTGEGSFVSLLDPPEWARTSAVPACRNVRTFPVLAGPSGTADLMISSPIILYDHPQIAPESPGDLFDATEIDEILSLRTLTLTQGEKAEVRATDPLAARLVDRVETMPTEVLARLHGAVRSLRRVGGVNGPGRPVATAGSIAAAGHVGAENLTAAVRDEPSASDSASDGEGDVVVVSGVRIGSGSRVRLAPRTRGTDVQDMFVAGRTATVAELLHDVDGSHFLAVRLDDDPRATMDAGPGRLLHFAPDEVEPLAVDGGTAGS